MIGNTTGSGERMPKRVISIFGLPSHGTKERVSGVDFARIIQPMEHLNGYEDADVKFEVKVYDPIKDETMNWVEVAQEFDLIYFNYTAMPWEFAKMGSMARKFGRPLVMDSDDSLWDIMPDNSAYQALGKGSEGIKNFTSICREVDYMTTTNKYLRNVISHHTLKPTGKIKIFPNYIDLDGLYTYRPKFKDTNDITLLHFGSTTHFIDLQTKEFEKGIDMIMRDYPNVTFKTVGALIPSYKYKWGQRYKNDYGHQDLYKWVRERFPLFMEETDIIVVPLEENRYTKCKSSIKFLEASSAKKAGVYQNIRQYEEVIEHGVNGYLADTAQDWYDSIKALIDDKKLRQRVAESAFKTVQDDWQMKNNVAQYAEFFKDILT